jgi:hypothetical protein
LNLIALSESDPGSLVRGQAHANQWHWTRRPNGANHQGLAYSADISLDSGLEAFSLDLAHGSFSPLTFQSSGKQMMRFSDSSFLEDSVTHVTSFDLKWSANVSTFPILKLRSRDLTNQLVGLPVIWRHEHTHHDSPCQLNNRDEKPNDPRKNDPTGRRIVLTTTRNKVPETRCDAGQRLAKSMNFFEKTKIKPWMRGR